MAKKKKEIKMVPSLSDLIHTEITDVGHDKNEKLIFYFKNGYRVEIEGDFIISVKQ